jgi:UDP-glucose 4,6-dehydratase
LTSPLLLHPTSFHFTLHFLSSHLHHHLLLLLLLLALPLISFLFSASHLVELLVKKYSQYLIVNYDKLDYCATLNNNIAVADAPNYKFVKGNILSLDLLDHVLKEYSIDTIMNFAAQTHVDNSFGNSCEFTKVNVLGTHMLLEAAKNAPTVRRFIHVSTDEVYGETINEGPAKEERMLAPTNPYAASKAAAEFIVKSYATSFNSPVIITRGNNVFGPKQYPEKLIPKFILRLLRGEACCIHGDGGHTRNFLFVEDVARAFDAVLHNGEIGNTYNIGTDFEISNLEVAKKLLQLFGLEKREDELITFVKDRAFNDRRYSINSSKLDSLGWKQQISWEEGLKRTGNSLPSFLPSFLPLPLTPPLPFSVPVPCISTPLLPLVLNLFLSLVEWYKSVDVEAHWPALSLNDILTPHPIKFLSSISL